MVLQNFFFVILCSQHHRSKHASKRGDCQLFVPSTSEEKIKLVLKRYVIDKLQLLFTAE